MLYHICRLVVHYWYRAEHKKAIGEYSASANLFATMTAPTHILFESSSGYALFESRTVEEIGSKVRCTSYVIFVLSKNRDLERRCPKIYSRPLQVRKDGPVAVICALQKCGSCPRKCQWCIRRSATDAFLLHVKLLICGKCFQAP